MIQDTLRNIGGIGLYGVVSICLFFAVFVGMLIWAFRLKKNYLNSMSAMPLENDPEISSSSPRTFNPDQCHD
jgi:hypothetical protein